MTNTVPQQRLLLWWLQALEKRIPYVWGGRSAGGLDCSGFITYPLFILSDGGINWLATHNTDKLWTSLQRVARADALPGDVAVYRGQHSTGPDDVGHVMGYLGSGLVVGQAYGGPANVDRKFSESRGHWTKALTVDYRNDLVGFVRLPLGP